MADLARACSYTQHYTKLEDAYWGEQAIEADKEASIGIKASLDFLKSDQ